MLAAAEATAACRNASFTLILAAAAITDEFITAEERRDAAQYGDGSSRA